MENLKPVVLSVLEALDVSLTALKKQDVIISEFNLSCCPSPKEVSLVADRG